MASTQSLRDISCDLRCRANGDHLLAYGLFVIKGIHHLTRLFLNLRECGITAAGMRYFASLCQCKSLVYVFLELGGNPTIGTSGETRYLEALKEHKSLTDLNIRLGACHLTDFDVQILSTLQQITSLRNLNLNLVRNHITDDGIRHLICYRRNNCWSLQKLQVSLQCNNAITDIGVRLFTHLYDDESAPFLLQLNLGVPKNITTETRRILRNGAHSRKQLCEVTSELFFF
jgi:Ran GTPase-activating protein (RanGAP) involved in mRNA processing and transport